MATEFKPYKHHGSIIYTRYNKDFLEALAEALEVLPLSEKKKLDMKFRKVRKITYLILFQNGKIYVTSKNNRSLGSIYLAEDK